MNTDVLSSTKLPDAPIGLPIPDIVSPSQLDASFLRALPDEMREEILEESRSVKRRRMEAAKAIGFKDKEPHDLRTTINEEDVIVVLSSSEDQNAINISPEPIQNELIDQSKEDNPPRKQGLVNQENFSILTKPRRLVQIMPNFFGATECEDVKKLFRRWVVEHDGNYC